MGIWIQSSTCDCEDCTGTCSHLTACDCALTGASGSGDDTNLNQFYYFRDDHGPLVRTTTVTFSYQLDPDGDLSSQGRIQLYAGITLVLDTGCSSANSALVFNVAAGELGITVVITSGCGAPTYDTDWVFSATCTP